MLVCEAQTQTDYSLSDIGRLEDFKSTCMNDKLRAETIIREFASYKDIKKRISDLFNSELRIKPRS